MTREEKFPFREDVLSPGRTRGSKIAVAYQAGGCPVLPRRLVMKDRCPVPCPRRSRRLISQVTSGSTTPAFSLGG